MPDFGPLGNEIVSSLIIGLLTWLGGQLLHRARTGAPRPPVVGTAAAPGSPPYPYPAPRPKPSVDFRQVALHIAVLQFAVNLLGLVLGIFYGLAFGTDASPLIFDSLVLLPAGTVLLAVGFFVVGMRVKRRVRWQHLLYVAVGEMIATLVVNSLLGVGPRDARQLIVAVIVATMQTFSAMGIGGGLAWLIKRNNPRDLHDGAVPVPAFARGYPYANVAPPSGPYYAPGPPSRPWSPPAASPYPPRPEYPPVPPSGPVYPPRPGPMPPYAPPRQPSQ